VAANTDSRVTITYDPPPNSYFFVGETPVSVTASDVSGTLSSCVFKVIVKDKCSGDLNKDERITPADALIAFKCYLGLDECPDCVDMNKDGEVTPADARCIFRIYLEVPDCQQDSDAALYKDCTGHSFYPGDTCSDESCIAEGMERKIFEEWKKQFLSIHNLSEEMFAERIEISDVKITNLWWRIDYVFVLDWVRSQQSESVSFNESSSDQEIEKAVWLAIEKGEQFDIPHIVSKAVVEDAFQDCGSDMNIDWCHIDFLNVSGELIVKGSKPLDKARNQAILPGGYGPDCVRAIVDVSTGELLRCYTEPCLIF